MLNRIRALEHSTALANCALFASCGCEAYETEYNIRDGLPSDLMGLLYPIRFGGFFISKINLKEEV